MNKLSGVEFVDFACEVFALGVYYWAPRFYARTGAEDGFSWEFHASTLNGLIS